LLASILFQLDDDKAEEIGADRSARQNGPSATIWVRVHGPVFAVGFLQNRGKAGTDGSRMTHGVFAKSKARENRLIWVLIDTGEL